MALSDVIKAGVKVAERIVTAGKLVVTVQHAAASRDANGVLVRGSDGEQLYATAVNRTAVFEDNDRPIRNDQGEVVVRQSRLLFFSDFTVTADDKITLPGGRIGKIDRIDKGVAVDGGSAVVQLYLGAG